MALTIPELLLLFPTDRPISITQGTFQPAPAALIVTLKLQLPAPPFEQTLLPPSSAHFCPQFQHDYLPKICDNHSHSQRSGVMERPSLSYGQIRQALATQQNVLVNLRMGFLQALLQWVLGGDNQWHRQDASWAFLQLQAGPPAIYLCWVHITQTRIWIENTKETLRSLFKRVSARQMCTGAIFPQL